MANDPMPPTTDREPVGDAGYLESDNDWCRRHSEAVTWFIENHVAVRAAMQAPRT